jgi:hypothetical protein
MARTFYITSQSRQDVIDIPAMVGDDQQISVDFRAWAEDNAALTTATWAVSAGDAAIDGTSLSGSVATARITTTNSGTSLISVSVTDGTRTKKQFFRIAAKDPSISINTPDYC